MKVFLHFLLLVTAVGGLFFYYTVSQAQRIVLDEEVPSDHELYKLQYCLEDSDCQVVKWQDCNQCPYSRSMNKRFTDYFQDNADYFNYPIGFNRHYCDALAKIARQAKSAAGVSDLTRPEVSCDGQQTEQDNVVASKCDVLLKQCYSVCQDDDQSTHRCSYDGYGQKFYDAYLGPLIDPVGNQSSI